MAAVSSLSVSQLQTVPSGPAWKRRQHNRPALLIHSRIRKRTSLHFRYYIIFDIMSAVRPPAAEKTRWRIKKHYPFEAHSGFDGERGRRDHFAALVLGFEDEVGLHGSDVESRNVVAEFAFRYAEHGRQLGPVAPRHSKSTAHISWPSRAGRAMDSSRSSLPANGGSLPASARNLVREPCAQSRDALTVIGV